MAGAASDVYRWPSSRSALQLLAADCIVFWPLGYNNSYTLMKEDTRAELTDTGVRNKHSAVTMIQNNGRNNVNTNSDVDNAGKGNNERV